MGVGARRQRQRTWEQGLQVQAVPRAHTLGSRRTWDGAQAGPLAACPCFSHAHEPPDVSLVLPSGLRSYSGGQARARAGVRVRPSVRVCPRGGGLGPSSWPGCGQGPDPRRGHSGPQSEVVSARPSDQGRGIRRPRPGRHVPEQTCGKRASIAPLLTRPSRPAPSARPGPVGSGAQWAWRPRVTWDRKGPVGGGLRALDPAPPWRGQKVSQTQGTLGPQASSVAGAWAPEVRDTPPWGLENATAHRARQGGRVRTPRVAPRPRASPLADPARAPHAGDGKGPPLPGPAAPRCALPRDSVFGNMADAEATPPPRLGSPGARGRASRAPSTARAASVAPLEVCWRPPGSGLPAPTPLGVPVPPCLPPQALRRAATHPGEGPCSK